MENILQPWVSWSFLQNNNHQAVKMEWTENSIHSIFLTAWWLLFCKKLHETQGCRVFSMDWIYIYIYIYIFIIIIIIIIIII